MRTCALAVRLSQPRLKTHPAEYVSTFANLIRPVSVIERFPADAAFGELEPVREEVGAIAGQGGGHSREVWRWRRSVVESCAGVLAPASWEADRKCERVVRVANAGSL